MSSPEFSEAFRKAATERTSIKLKEALADGQTKAESAERDVEKKRIRGFLFDDANAPKEEDLAVPPGLASIVEKVFLKDAELETAYDFVHANLKLGERLTEHGFLVRALDNAEEVHRTAHRIYVSAKVERSAWEREAIIISAALRSEATKHLQHEKDKGRRNKTITDADVDSTCAWLFPDEWKSQNHRRDRLKATEDSLGNLVEVCASRCRTLQALLNRHR